MDNASMSRIYLVTQAIYNSNSVEAYDQVLSGYETSLNFNSCSNFSSMKYGFILDMFSKGFLILKLHLQVIFYLSFSKYMIKFSYYYCN